MTFGTGTLTVGSTGAGVTELQQWLIDRSFLIDQVTPSSSFDDSTHHAVRAFQFSAGIGVDGVVGGGTRTAAEGFAGTALTTGWHPSAVRNVQVDRSGGTYTTDTRRGLLHTTEGTRLPNYDGTQPHFTIGRNGAGAAVQLWQHLPITVAARALRNSSGGEQTNRHGVIQIEIIGSAASMGDLATTDPDLFTALGQWMRWVEATTGVARVSNHAFDGDASYGLTGTTRLSEAEWAATTGWIGHQHVPENTHWDPGRIDIAALLAVPALATNGGVGTPGPTPSPMSLTANGNTPTRTSVGTVPTIRATTRRLTDAFPSLTFAIDTAGNDYFEVVLTTDRTLFDPGQASRRTDENFYRSAVDGLRAASNAHGRFVAPVGAIQRFATARPTGGPIFYAIFGYQDEHGARASASAAAIDLARTAPYVAMMPGFRGHTATETLGVPLSMLRRPARRLAGIGAAATGYGSDTAIAPPPATVQPGNGGSRRIDPLSDRMDGDRMDGDRMEGEDGYDIARVNAPPSVPAPPEMPSATPPAADATQPVDGPPGPIDAVLAASYDDGFGGDRIDGTVPEPTARASGADFPAGHSQPRSLYDAESPFVGPDDEFDDLGWAGTSYGTNDAASDPPAQGSRPAPALQRTTSPSVAEGWRTLAPQLAPEHQRDVIEAFVGDDTELYVATNPDGEFEGRAGTDHPAYQRYHLGLSFGIVGFSQDSGALGQLLVMMRRRDETAFASTFGPDASALVDTLTSPGPLSRDVDGGRSVRVQPVAGIDVWEAPWTARFVEAGRSRQFQGAQIELAAGMYLDPITQFAMDLGLSSERGFAMIFDRAAHRGAVGGMNWVIETVGPIQTPILLRDALNGLGFADVESFQRSQPDLLVDDQFGALTHAALTAALRASGATSPPRLSYEQMITAMVDRATGQPWGDRIVRLGRAGASDDIMQAELVE